MIELMSVLLLVAFLLGGGVLLYTDLRSGVADDGALTRLQSVAATERQLYQQRGSFITDPDVLAAREGEALFTVDEASGTAISIAVSDRDGMPVLLLATLSTENRCQVLITTPAGNADQQYVFETDTGRGCNAATESQW